MNAILLTALVAERRELDCMPASGGARRPMPGTATTATTASLGQRRQSLPPRHAPVVLQPVVRLLSEHAVHAPLPGVSRLLTTARPTTIATTSITRGTPACTSRPRCSPITCQARRPPKACPCPLPDAATSAFRREPTPALRSAGHFAPIVTPGHSSPLRRCRDNPESIRVNRMLTRPWAGIRFFCISCARTGWLSSEANDNRKPRQ